MHRLLVVRHVVVVLCAAALVSACGGEEPTPTAPPPTPTAIEVVAPTATPEPPTPEPTATQAPTPLPQGEAAPTLWPMTSITVAVNAEFKPFLYKDETGRLVGFDIDLIEALATAGNFEPAYVDRAFDGMLEGVAAGQYDAAISAITINDARKELVDFTPAYFEPGQAPVSFFSSGQGLAVAGDNATITGTASLIDGVKVGVKTGTTGDDFATNETGAEVVRFPESEPALDALVAGEVDAVVLDIAVMTDYIKTHPGAVKLVGGLVTQEEYGIAVNKERPELLERLTAALEQIRSNGAYDAIFAKWFGAP